MASVILNKQMIAYLCLPQIYAGLQARGDLKECSYCRVEITNGQCGCGASAAHSIPKVSTRFLRRNEFVQWRQISTDPVMVADEDLNMCFDDFQREILRVPCLALTDILRKQVRHREHSHEIVIDDQIPFPEAKVADLKSSVQALRASDPDSGLCARVDIGYCYPEMRMYLSLTMRFAVVAKVENRVGVRETAVA